MISLRPFYEPSSADIDRRAAFPERDRRLRLLPTDAQRPVMGRIAVPAGMTGNRLRNLDGSGMETAPSRLDATRPVMGFTRPIFAEPEPGVMGRIEFPGRSPHETIDNLANAETMAEPPNGPNYLANLADIQAGRELAKLRYQDTHHWGTPENHPGIMGKIGHVMGAIGNVAGDTFASGVMAEIPSTNLGRRVRERELENQLETGRKDETAFLRAEHGLTPNLTPAESTFKTLTSQGVPPLKAMGEISLATHPARTPASAAPVAGYSPDAFHSRIAKAFPNLPPDYVQSIVDEVGTAPTRKQLDAAFKAAQAEAGRRASLSASAAGRKQSESATERREARTQRATAGREREHEIFSAKQQLENWKASQYATLERARAAGQLTDAGLDQAKQRIEDLYAQRLGQIQNRTFRPYEYAPPKGMVAVQIPGQPVGHIPRSSLAQFKKDHPNAKVLGE